MTAHIESLARSYFEIWNTHDGAAVAGSFAEEGTLRDWDISVSGAKSVGEANQVISDNHRDSRALINPIDYLTGNLQCGSSN
jgi:hypothetical protein